MNTETYFSIKSYAEISDFMFAYSNMGSAVTVHN